MMKPVRCVPSICRLDFSEYELIKSTSVWSKLKFCYFSTYYGMLLKDIPIAVVNIDDIVVFGKAIAEHNEAVKTVLQRLSAVPVYLKLKKARNANGIKRPL